MSTLSELLRQHTTLQREQVAHLNGLVSEWGMLADFCFADLLLYVPTSAGQWLTVAQVRPATGQTIYRSDWVGSWANDTERPVLSKVFESGETTEGEIIVEGLPDHARMLAIPVRHGDEIVAVLTREWAAHTSRTPGELELTYLSTFERFATMIVEGSFPFPGRVADSSAAPRVGDGVMVLDADARVEYASPNAVSALHRVGIRANAVGMRLAELGFNDGPIRQAYERRVPVVEEFDQTAEVSLLCRCIPIMSDHHVAGGVLLMRDVTELRKRDRLLLTKDATIREIHHRVKNNLQTISSLLRLQARRLASAEAKAAVSESVRRIRTIALVHEALSREPGEDVTFIEIVRPLLRLAEESLQSIDRPVQFRIRGEGGRIPAAIATPLSVVLTELLQNAVDHGFPEGSPGGQVVVMLDNAETELRVEVVDNGRGVDPAFELDQATGLGLSIVRTLVTTELNGEITMAPVSPADLEVAGLADAGSRHGTTVRLRVPLEE
jgi:two-component sensor histidine kinase